jgi:hypothetical protein
MQVAALMVLRNEADILEASIRHNLTVVDSLVVVDHESDDETPAILASLVDEGLSIDVRSEGWMDFGSAGSTIRHLRSILAGSADACLLVEADEFLRVPSRPAFDSAIRDADPTRIVAIPRSTHVPPFDARRDLVARLREARRIAVGSGLGNVVVHRAPPGPHGVAVDGYEGVNSREGIPAEAGRVVMPDSVASVAHIPVRSTQQLTAEVAAMQIVRLLAAGTGSVRAFQWQDELEAIVAGGPLAPEQLIRLAACCHTRSGTTTRAADLRLVDDPFLADIRLTYTPAIPPYALGHVLALGERIALAIAHTTGGM